MRVLTVVLGLGTGLATVLAAGPASADYLDIETVRAMAFDQGIVHLEEVELDDGVWKVEGEDEYGQEIEMEVDARSGRIVKMKRD